MSNLLCDFSANLHAHSGGADDAFILSDLRVGEMVTLCGEGAQLLAFFLAVQHLLRCKSPVVFIDGGNSFSPYLIAELVRRRNFDPREALKRIYVSRAFTSHQLFALATERLKPLVEKLESKLVIVSDIASLFFHRDVHDSEAKAIFLRLCMKLSEIAERKQVMVLITYVPKNSRRRLYFEAALFGRSDIIIETSARGGALHFALRHHPHVWHFSAAALPRASLMDYLEA
jgi:hypothetical protein